MKRRPGAWAAAAALACGLPGGAAAQLPELDSLVAAEMRRGHTPGLAAAAVDSGRVVWIGTYGLADLAARTPVTETTLFMLASVSKPIAVAALAQLSAAGAFGLDDDVSDHLPFAVRNPRHPETPITVRQLLRHRSSIRDDIDFYRPFWSTADGDPTLPLGGYLRDYLVPDGAYYDAEKNFFPFAPGSEKHYCNTCYALLGYLAERLAGEPFQRASERLVLEPLCMRRAGWMLADVDTAAVAMPHRWTEQDGVFAFGQNGYPDWPAGQLRASIQEVARFLAAWSWHGRLDGRQVLDSASIQRFTPRDMDLGFHTWFAGGMPEGQAVYSHGGGDAGVRTYMAYRPTTGRGVVVLTNGEGDPDAVARAVYARIDALKTRPPDLPACR